MGSLRMSMLLLPPSRPRGPSSLLTGAQLVSRLASTTSLPQLFQEVTWPRSSVLSACCPIPQLLLKPGLVLIISLILCMPRELLCTGTLEKVWRRVSSQRPVRILLPLRKITRRSVLILLTLRVKARRKNTRLSFGHPPVIHLSQGSFC